MARDQGFTIRDAAGLRAARAGTASAIIAAEGADFLEGNPDRVEESYAKWPYAICNSPITASTNWATFKPNRRFMAA